ncbi:SMI1/KNR4 family protein [Achromobacter mucicolens]|uniref:SMI1/KNR4 family protein n=1 Tax=Achromobacter mucicolens TaxID=1389922 RepID=UPI00244CFD38|nr:SMI1/KNR4 family protein [Achromobacter mucicolens]MDG9970086.1 SMI1/KNR4 family protein [Achromobacter mucicolens]
MNFSLYLDRLRAVCDAHGHALHLNPGAAESGLEAVEAELGFPIAADARQAWLLTNGAERDAPVFMRPGYLTAYDFLPLEKAIAGRARMADRAPRYAGYEEPEPRDARIRDGWFHPGWLPFASFGGATMLLMVDHSPSESGTPGQIIAFTHDPDQITWVAPSFAALLTGSIAEVEADPEEFLGDF